MKLETNSDYFKFFYMVSLISALVCGFVFSSILFSFELVVNGHSRPPERVDVRVHEYAGNLIPENST